MTRAVEEKIEHIKLKVFLYKFTPDFDRDKGAETTQKSLAKIDRYRINLDEAQSFWKFDVTDFVSSYSFSQNLESNTISWNMVLQDSQIRLEDLDKRIRIKGPDLTKLEGGKKFFGRTIGQETVLDTTVFERIAEYEAEARELADTPIILEAKKRRGETQPSLTTRTGPTRPAIPTDAPLTDVRKGLFLSDLIQRYDLISCFLYKNNTPVSELRGKVEKSTSFDKLPVFTLEEKKTGFVNRFKSTFKGGKKLTGADLQNESVLLSKVSSTGESLYSNEINGFITTKTTRISVNGVNVVNLSGSGITRLFGSTRRVMKPSLFQRSIYDIAELVDPGQAVAFQNIYVNSTLEEIFADLFNIVYRIKFRTGKSSTFNFARLFGLKKNTTATEFTGVNFYDLSSIIVGNALQTNVFTVPAFLLSLVMRDRGFAYREPNPGFTGQLINEAKTNATREDDIIVQSEVDETLDTFGQQKTATGKSPVFFSSEIDELKAYFKLITDVFNFFNPELRTPFEIIDEIKQRSFLEFIERCDGVLIIRAPQYNDTTSTIFSSDLDIQNLSYTENVDGLISRQKVGYGTDIIESVESIKEYAYSNGKLLIQYGFMEAGADINPNVKNDKSEQKSDTDKKDNGLAKYAEYFLRMQNASLKTGTVACNLNPRVRVGKTFFDERNQKFGYINSVSKTVTVGGTATMTFSLKYVRDAFLGDTVDVDSSGNPIVSQTGSTFKFIGPRQQIQRKDAKDGRFLKFEVLPRLVDIAERFTEVPPDSQVIDPEPDLLTFEA